MSNDLTIAILAGLGGMLGWGFADFFAKKTIDEIGDESTLFWGQVIGLVPLVLWFLIARPDVVVSGGDVWSLLVFGVVTGLSYLTLYRGFGKGEVSLLSPIFASYSGVVVIISALVFDEQIPGGRLAALALMFVGILLTAIDIGGIRDATKRRAINGVGSVLTAMVVYSVWLVLWDQFIHGREWLPFLIIMRAVAALTVLAETRIRGHKIVIPRRNVLLAVTLVGLCDVGAYAAVSAGFSATSLTSVVAVLSAAFSVPTIILASVFLKEKMTRLQVAGATAIILGIVLVTR